MCQCALIVEVRADERHECVLAIEELPCLCGEGRDYCDGHTDAITAIEESVDTDSVAVLNGVDGARDCETREVVGVVGGVGVSGKILQQWNALFDAHPWLEGLTSSGTCKDVFCCPAASDPDYAVLTEVSSLLFLANGPASTGTLNRSLIDNPKAARVA